MVLFFIFLAGCAAVNAAVLPIAKAATPILEARAATCTPAVSGSSSADDVPAIHEAIRVCSSGTIVIPAGRTYNINSAVSFADCNGCTLQVEGTLKVSSDLDYWSTQKAAFLMDGVRNAKVVSKTGSGLFDGNGQAAWDRFANDSSLRRATLFYINNSHNVLIRNLRFKNAANVFHEVNGGSTYITYDKIKLDATSKSTILPKNTDGWALWNSSFVTITNVDVSNQDDCVGFKSGCTVSNRFPSPLELPSLTPQSATVRNITCTGSHGLSVGSLGRDPNSTDTVSNVLVDGATMRDGTKAVGIKFYPGGPSHGVPVARNVTFQNVAISNIDRVVHIQSCYGEDEAYCSKYPSTGKIEGVVIKGFKGTTSERYAPDVGSVNCPAKGSCGIKMAGMDVKAPGGEARWLCANTREGLGVICGGVAKG